MTTTHRTEPTANRGLTITLIVAIVILGALAVARGQITSKCDAARYVETITGVPSSPPAGSTLTCQLADLIS